MKVFISWSGERSKAVAMLLSDWIKCVIQATKPWISSRDIDRGALWFTEIGDQLKDTSVGIVCLTQENKNKPWILFETGALAKGLSSNRVCTLLVDLKPEDLEDPLAQFNHTMPTQDGLWSLVRTLNSSLLENRLEERILEQVFNIYWSDFEKKFNEILDANPQTEKPKPRSEKNLLSEILDNTRFLSHRIRTLEAKVESNENSNSTLRGTIFDADRFQSKTASQVDVKIFIQRMLDSGVAKSEVIELVSKLYKISPKAVSFHITRLMNENEMLNTNNNSEENMY